MEYGGIRRRLVLGTALKEEAALKARDIYLSLVAKGWSATLAELVSKPSDEAMRSEFGSTVGEFISEVERTSNLKTKTFRRYAQYFRMLAAQIQGVKTDASRYNYYGGGLLHDPLQGGFMNAMAADHTVSWIPTEFIGREHVLPNPVAVGVGVFAGQGIEEVSSAQSQTQIPLMRELGALELKLQGLLEGLRQHGDPVPLRGSCHLVPRAWYVFHSHSAGGRGEQAWAHRSRRRISRRKSIRNSE